MIKRNYKMIITVLLCFLILSTCYTLVLKQDYMRERERYNYIARNQTDNITRVVDCVVARVNTLESLVLSNKGTTDFFESVAANIYESVKEDTGVTLKNMALAPEGKVTKVYPLAGNESFIGFNYLDDTAEGNAEAIRAYNERVMLLSNPFMLMQGGLGMTVRCPVIVEGKNWGIASLAIDFSTLLEVFNLSNFDGMGITYRLSCTSDDGTEKILADNGAIAENPVTERFTIRNLTWEFSIAPVEGWFNYGRIIIILVLILLVSFLLGFFLRNIFKLRESNKSLVELSNTDSLSGLLNRRAFETEIEKHENGILKENFVYVSIDINGLKCVNTRFGHEAGNELIKGAAECLAKGMNDYGKIYRIDGDEFIAMIVANGEQLDEVKLTVEKAASSWKGNMSDKLSLSMGFATAREFPGKSLSEISRIADERRLAQKKVFYSMEENDRRTKLEKDV